MTEYDYSKTPCSIDRLTQEIQRSIIVTALDHINLFGDSLSIFFKTDISDNDKSTLDAIVIAHTGTPLPENVIQTVNIGTSPSLNIMTMPALADNNAGNGKLYYQRV